VHGHRSVILRLFRALVAWILCGLTTTAMPRAEPLTLGWQNVHGINLFYREGGPRDAPTIVFLPGNPLSSIQYARVMEQLVDTHAFHVLAVDYPSFGYSDAPDPAQYRYTFDHIATTVQAFLEARGITHYGLYMQDYGVPIGFRLMRASPDSITTIVVQNGVIHLDGFPSA
jgi:pimeloyl-ACP methyl ester carboxylesterase